MLFHSTNLEFRNENLLSVYIYVPRKVNRQGGEEYGFSSIPGPDAQRGLRKSPKASDTKTNAGEPLGFPGVLDNRLY